MNILKYIGIVIYITMAYLYYFITLNGFYKNEKNLITQITRGSTDEQNTLKSQPKSSKPPIGQEKSISPPLPMGGAFHKPVIKAVSNKDAYAKSDNIKQKENTNGTNSHLTLTPPNQEIPLLGPLPKIFNEPTPLRLDISHRNTPIGNTSEVLDFQQALKLADNGNARAQAIVSIYYGVGYKTQKDTVKAADYAMRSAKQHNGLGIYRLAAMIENGEGFEKNALQAKKLKESVVNDLITMEGDPYALTALGVMLFRGDGGLSQDKTKAFKFYKMAADMGYAPAQYNYSAALALGHGITKNEQESLRYWQAAYDQNYPPALAGLIGQSSSNAKPTEKNSSGRSLKLPLQSNQRLPRGIPVSGRPGFVSSPYAPGAGLVDARGVKSGETLTCPFTRQLFLMP